MVGTLDAPTIKSKGLHEIAGSDLGRANCPLKELSQAQAKKLAPELVAYLRKNSSADKQAYIQEQISEAKKK